MNEPVWILKAAVLAAHAKQLAEHGGSDGVRDETLLDSALGKPRNVFAYEEGADLFRLAASYGFGIARSHPFVDGNKRTALAVCIGTLVLHGWDIEAPREELYWTFLRLAEGTLPELELGDWLRVHAAAVDAAG